MSDMAITNCPTCGQEMHPTDYHQRLREQLAAANAARERAEAELRELRSKPDPLGEALNSGDGAYRP